MARAAENRYDNRYWCCDGCRRRIAEVGEESAVDEMRRSDPEAARELLSRARELYRSGSWGCARHFYGRAIACYERLALSGCEEWIDTLDRVKAEAAETSTDPVD
jgi:hypothetical protein